MSELLQFILSQQDQFRRARLPSLFSDFTAQRYTNPNGYVANVKIWEDALCKAAMAGLVSGQDGIIRRFSLEIGPRLLQKLESKEWGRPLALNTVTNEAVSQGRMIPHQEFLSSPNSIYIRRWTDLPWRLVSWGLGQVGLQQRQLGTYTPRPSEFVLIPNLEEVSGTIMTYLQKRSSLVDRILTKDMFRRDLAVALGITDELSDNDLRTLLTYLARNRQALAYDEDVVKVAASNEISPPLFKEDREIASLKSLMYDVNEQIGSLETRIAFLQERGQKAVEIKNRSLALTALKSKKAAESVLARRTDTLFQLEEIYGKIGQASDQITTIRVMKGSAEVLRGLNAKVGTTQDVEDVLDNLKEEMGKVEDVGTVINQAGQETNAVDDDEVDEELNALMRESQTREEKKAAEEIKRTLASIETPIGADDKTTIQPTMAENGQGVTGPKASETSLNEEISALERMSLDEEPNSSPDVVRDSQSRESSQINTLETS